MPHNRSISAVAIAAACLISSCSSDDKSSSTPSTTPADALATAAMVPAIQTMLDLGAGTPESAVTLNACPLGDFEALVAKGPAGVQTSAQGSGGESDTFVFQPEGEPSHLQCDQGDVGAYTSVALPGDFREETVLLLSDYIVTFEDDTAHRGGTIVRFCTEVIGVGGGEFCEADWYDANVWIGVYIDGEGRSSELAQQWLIAILDDVVANVPQQATTVEPLN